MTNCIVAQEDFQGIVNRWIESESKGESFPVDFDIAWQVAGYATKASAKRAIDKYMEKGVDYLFNKVLKSTGGRGSEVIHLTCDALKELCMLSRSEVGKTTRKYFIDAEKKWKMVEKHHPAIASEIEILKLQAEISGNQRFIMERSESILNIHGKEVLALVQGRPDVVVHDEFVVTEVVDIPSKTSTKILSAEQLKKAVKQRTGQNLPSQKGFVDSLRKAGRDDLLVPVTRSRTDEYVKPEKLDEAIAVVYSKNRQRLIGES